MQRVTSNQLTNILLANEVHSFVGVSAVTDAGTIKTNRKTGQKLSEFLSTPNARILKAMRGTFSIGNSYAAAVNNRRERDGMEPNFSAEPHGWMESVSDSKVIGRKRSGGPERYIVAFFFNTPQTPANLQPKSFYFDSESGARLAYEDIRGWLKSKGESSRQGLPEDLQVIYRNFKVRSIHRLAIGGEVYEVIDTLFPPPPSGLDIHAFTTADASLYATYVRTAIGGDAEALRPVVERVEAEFSLSEDPFGVEAFADEETNAGK